ncbi:aldo/keto reductase [Amnibacterium endophyticum]|uniref:Aldo/keto reductase n=1 Tax=Amnibacterium endophyticum TaxID=2109337 RepID=A0ABW4LGG0_9MICO
MDAIPLGLSGLSVSRVVAGPAREPVPVARGVRVLHEAWELGVRALDVTDGARARETAAQSFLDERQPEDAVLLAAIGVPVDPERGSDLSPDRVTRGATARAPRLGRLDAVWLRGTDRDTAPEATVTALAAAIAAGTIRAWGAGDADVRALEGWLTAADSAGLPRPAFARVGWSLLDRQVEEDLLELAFGEDVAVLPTRVFAGGRLSDRHVAAAEETERAVAAGAERTAPAEPRLEQLIALRDLARERDVSTQALALAWLLAHPANPAPIVPAVPGPGWDAVPEAVEAAPDLDEETWARIDELFADPGF